MKTFNKLLAAVLSLIMLLSIVPVAVFANTADGVISGETSDISDLAEKGTGADGTVSLTLNSDALIAALQSETPSAALLALLRDAIDCSATEVFTAEDLLLLIPVKKIIDTVKEVEPEVYGKILSQASSAVDYEALFAYIEGLDKGEMPEGEAELLADLIQFVDVRQVLAAVKSNLSQLATEELIEKLTLVVLTDAVDTIDLVRIEGYDVLADTAATSDTPCVFDYENANRAMEAITSDLTKFVNAEDDRLLSVNVELAYSRYGRTVEKDLCVEVVLDAPVSAFRSFAKALSDFVSVSTAGNDLYIDVTMSRELTEALSRYLENCPNGQYADAEELCNFLPSAEERAALKLVLRRYKDLIVSAAASDYEAISDLVKLVQDLDSNGIVDMENHPLANAYRGNGKFEIAKSTHTLNLGDLLQIAPSVLSDAGAIEDEYAELICSLLPSTESLNGLTFSIHLNAVLPNVSRAVFMNKDGSVSKTMLLPNGAHPGEIHTVGENFSCWIDEKGQLVSEITQDVTLYPVGGFVTGGSAQVDADNNWTFTSNTDTFNIAVNLTGADEDAASLIAALKSADSVTFANAQGLKITAGKDLLAKVITNTTEYFAVSHIASQSSGAISSADGKISFTPATVNSFNLSVNGVAVTEFGGEAFQITVPFASAVAANDSQRTVVYSIVDGKLAEETLDFTVNAGVGVVLNAKHFSEYAVVNEYNFSVECRYEDGSAFTKDSVTVSTKGFIPEGASFIVDPAFADGQGKRIVSISCNGQALHVGDTFTMPSEAVTLVCVIEEQKTNVIYNVFGKFISGDSTAAWTEVQKAVQSGNLPAGYYAVDTSKKWVVSEITNSIIYYVPALKAIEFKVSFEGASSADDTFTVDDLTLTVPAIKGENGQAGYWTVNGKALNMAEIIKANTKKDAVVTLNATVKYETNIVTYTLNGETRTGVVGSVASFDIVLAGNEYLAAAPMGCKLSAMKNDESTNSRIYTYTFTVQENLNITYEISNEKAATQLVNGMETQSKATDVKGLAFKDFSAALETKNASYAFAIFGADGTGASLLWLWILLALAVIIVLIAIIYNLYIREKMKPSFLTRFVTGIVTVFFNICVAFSSLFLVITQGTSETGKVSYEAMGMKTPDELTSEKKAEKTKK